MPPFLMIDNPSDYWMSLRKSYSKAYSHLLIVKKTLPNKQKTTPSPTTNKQTNYILTTKRSDKEVFFI